MDRGRVVGLWEYDVETYIREQDVETYIREQLGDARGTVLDPVKSRAPRIKELRGG
ncbi:hypothetical protein AB0J38_24545 [Streptomyces sp. NPDC050095]|uniref:hypothetical protein n=1 Tax=unclassified Streptomyces TaxID=2593676 RepID=UPI0034172C2D